jgi:uncharacterized membrane protein
MLQAFMHWLGFGLCHQLPDRSFFGGGVQLPVCARDTGIYIGFCLSLGLIALLHRGERPREFPTAWGWTAMVLMISSMAVDGGSQSLGVHSSTNELRLITGLASGFAIAMLVVPMLNDTLWRSSQARRVLDPLWRLGVWLVALPVSYVAVMWGGPLLGVGYPILVAFAILFTLVCVNLVMICLMPWFDRKASRLIDVWPAALLGLVVSLLEVWLAGLLRYGLIALAARFS